VECTAAAVDQRFSRWADPAEYKLVPNGRLESSSGWRLEDGARTVADQEPWRVNNGGDDRALALPDGSRAVSRPTCAGLVEPTLRFFLKRVGGDAGDVLQVDVLFEDWGGTVRSVPIGFLVNSGRWAPSPPLALLVNLLPLLPDEKTPVAFRFSPRGDADWRIDGVHVDPVSRH